MINPVNRTITFEAVNEVVAAEQKASSRGIPHQVLSFTIEPPLEIHDPSFLDKAVEREAVADKRRYTNGAFPYVTDVSLTFTDEYANHGTARIQTNTKREVPRKLIETAFTKAIDPFGKGGLDFIFDASTAASGELE